MLTKSKKGEVAQLILLLGFIVAVAYIGYRQDNPPGTKGSHIAKSALHNLYLSCKEFWKENSPKKECGLDQAGKYYDFKTNEHFVSLVASGNNNTFKAIATYLPNKRKWSIDNKGAIREE